MKIYPLYISVTKRYNHFLLKIYKKMSKVKKNDKKNNKSNKPETGIFLIIIKLVPDGQICFNIELKGSLLKDSKYTNASWRYFFIDKTCNNIDNYENWNLPEDTNDNENIKFWEFVLF